jgi:hypothetical protein
MTGTGLAWSDVSARVGQSFAVEGGPALTLAAATPIEGAVRDGGGFRLDFVGPLHSQLEQGTYRFILDDVPVDIFIVPIARDSVAVRYEAVFF